MADPNASPTQEHDDEQAPSTPGTVTRAYVDDITDQTVPGGPGGLRERASELAIFWSWVAAGLLVAMLVVWLAVAWQHMVVERDLMREVVAGRGLDLSNATLLRDLTEQSFERTARLLDRLFAVFVPLLTAIVGYVFGARSRR